MEITKVINGDTFYVTEREGEGYCLIDGRPVSSFELVSRVREIKESYNRLIDAALNIKTNVMRDGFRETKVPFNRIFVIEYDELENFEIGTPGIYYVVKKKLAPDNVIVEAIHDTLNSSFPSCAGLNVVIPNVVEPLNTDECHRITSNYKELNPILRRQDKNILFGNSVIIGDNCLRIEFLVRILDALCIMEKRISNIPDYGDQAETLERCFNGWSDSANDFFVTIHSYVVGDTVRCALTFRCSRTSVKHYLDDNILGKLKSLISELIFELTVK